MCKGSSSSTLVCKPRSYWGGALYTRLKPSTHVKGLGEDCCLLTTARSAVAFFTRIHEGRMHCFGSGGKGPPLSVRCLLQRERADDPRSSGCQEAVKTPTSPQRAVRYPQSPHHPPNHPGVPPMAPLVSISEKILFHYIASFHSGMCLVVPQLIRFFLEGASQGV